MKNLITILFTVMSMTLFGQALTDIQLRAQDSIQIRNKTYDPSRAFDMHKAIILNKVNKQVTVNGHALTGNVTVTKSDVGLSNVDNTSDVNKTVSTAQQAALNLKADTVNSWKRSGRSVLVDKTIIDFIHKSLTLKGDSLMLQDSLIEVRSRGFVEFIVGDYDDTDQSNKSILALDPLSGFNIEWSDPNMSGGGAQVNGDYDRVQIVSGNSVLKVQSDGFLTFNTPSALNKRVMISDVNFGTTGTIPYSTTGGRFKSGALSYSEANTRFSGGRISLSSGSPTTSSIFIGNTGAGSPGNATHTGSGNIGIGASGSQCLSSLTNGGSNIAIGVGLASVTSGANNIAIGNGLALNSVTTSLNNTAIGTSAGLYATGSRNTFLGSQTGQNVTTGNNNVVIGYNCYTPTATGDGQLSIQNAIYGINNTGDNGVVSTGNIGLYVPAPSARLHLVAGSATANTSPLKLTSGTNLTTAEAGAIEYDGTNLYFSPSTIRRKIALIANGSHSQVGSSTTVFTVTIGTTQANTTYNVQVTPTASLSAAPFYVTNKTTTTFDVTYLSGLTGTVTFDWTVTP